jgi:hypothetical protein
LNLNGLPAAFKAPNRYMVSKVKGAHPGTGLNDCSFS